MPQGRKLTDEEIAQIRERLGAGESARDIAKSFGISPRTVRNYEPSTRITTSGKENGAQFLDVEANFLAHLKSYGVQDPARIVDYISSQGGNAYTNLEVLKRCLISQRVGSGKVYPIIEHWANKQSIPIPESLAREMIETISKEPERWGIELRNGLWLPVRDSSGDYSSLDDTRKVCRDLNSQTQQQGDDKKVVWEQLAQERAAREAVERQLEAERQARREESDRAFREQVTATLNAIQSQMNAQNRGLNEYHIMDKGLTVFKEEISNLRRDFFGLMRGAPAPMSLEERTALTEAISRTVEEETTLDALAAELFYGGEFAARGTKPAPPPTTEEARLNELASQLFPQTVVYE